MLVYHLGSDTISGLYLRTGKEVLYQLVTRVYKILPERLLNDLEIFQEHSLCEYVLDVEYRFVELFQRGKKQLFVIFKNVEREKRLIVHHVRSIDVAEKAVCNSVRQNCKTAAVR